MSNPFYDLETIQAALATMADDGLVTAVRVLGGVGRGALPAVPEPPEILIGPESSRCDGPAGLGNGRRMTDTVGVLIRLRRLDGDAASAGADLRTLRGEIFDRLEGQTLDAAWAPLRYQGGQMVAVAEGLYSWIERYASECGTPTRPRGAL